ncbi:MAG: hypothetical protein IOC90_10845 [Methylocystis sp.]|nr:hypothetical protein [Methylocystis sp.]MCA3583432.1 hypothetical protein [Methylocystis sp.]MCA3588515.1 hypothetical protein [Methylocystis sp.]MCA3591951.1 hypothetical protein [Methylocystis sp.]
MKKAFVCAAVTAFVAFASPINAQTPSDPSGPISQMELALARQIRVGSSRAEILDRIERAFRDDAGSAPLLDFTGLNEESFSEKVAERRLNFADAAFEHGGRLSLEDIHAAFTGFFSGVDTNMDDTIGRDEFDRLRRRIGQAEREANATRYRRIRLVEIGRKIPECRMAHAALSEAAELVVVNANPSGAFTNLALVDKPQVMIRLQDLTIEDGDRPLHVAVRLTVGTALRLNGAVWRVSQLALFSDGGRAMAKPLRPAVSGIPAAKITVSDDLDCLPLLSPQSLSDQAHHVGKLFGRQPDWHFAPSEYQNLLLPSGAAGREADMAGYRPKTAEARSMVADFSALYTTAAVRMALSELSLSEGYTVHAQMPFFIGLVPLVDEGLIIPSATRRRSGIAGAEGMLEVIGDLKGIQLGEGLRMIEVQSHERFVITGPVILPPHLTGPGDSRRIRFDLAEGAPLPKGTVPNDCLFDLKTGNPLLGSVVPEDCE